jgi:hypothetical protein
MPIPPVSRWLGSVVGHRTKALGVDRFGQSGSIAELYAPMALIQPPSSGPRRRDRSAGGSPPEAHRAATRGGEPSATRIGFEQPCHHRRNTAHPVARSSAADAHVDCD